jgi:hypothetical protein
VLTSLLRAIHIISAPQVRLTNRLQHGFSYVVLRTTA